MLEEELLELLLKLKRYKRKPHFTLNEIVKYVLNHDSTSSVTTIIIKLKRLERKHLVRRIRRLKYRKEIWGFPIYETVYVIYDRLIERYLNRGKTLTLWG